MTYIDDEPRDENGLTPEQAEEIALEEERKHDETMGYYYKGIWQGLILGIFGNFLVSFFLEFFNDVIPVEYLWAFNLIGFLTMMVITSFLAWNMYVTAETYLKTKIYIQDLKKRILKTIIYLSTIVAILFAIVYLVYFVIPSFVLLAQSSLASFVHPIEITETLFVDVYGGLLPTIIAFFAFAYVILSKKCKIKLIFLDCVIGILFAIFVSNFLFLILDIPNSFNNVGSLVIDYFLVGVISSLLAFLRATQLIKYIRNCFKKRKILKISYNYSNIISILSLSFFYGTISVLVLDLVGFFIIRLFSSNITVNIGAKGLADGIILSPLVSVFLVITYYLCKILFVKITSQIYENPRRASLR